MNSKKNIAIRIIMASKKVLFLVFAVVCFSSVHAQIPKRAYAMADSILKTRITCLNSDIKFVRTFNYSVGKNEEIYQFYYRFHPKKDLSIIFYIYIKNDYSDIRISGIPSQEYSISPCEIKSRKELWKIAKRNGLKTNYARCEYSVVFHENRIAIRFHERRRRFINVSKIPFSDVNYYEINALTGDFIEHRVFTFTL